jgi:hypothetical protein
MAGFYLTVGEAQRKCHLCHEKIPKETLHLRVHFRGEFKRQSYINICSDCLNMDRIMNSKYIGRDSSIQEVVKDYKAGARTKLDAILGTGEEGETIWAQRRKKTKVEYPTY